MRKQMRTMTAGVDSQPSSKKKRERIPPSAEMVIPRGTLGDGMVRRKDKGRKPPTA